MKSVVSLPDGRHIGLGSDVATGLRCGVVVAANVRIGPAPALSAEIHTLREHLRVEHAGKRPADIGALQEARRLYRSVGIDPTKTRPSSEALLRRVLRGQPLYSISNAVDACNLASLRFLLPIGLYDLDRVCGDVTLRLGRAGDEYAGIRKGTVHLEGRLGLFDADGPFGSPTSDSARTCVHARTAALLAVIMATNRYGPAAMQQNTKLLGDLLIRHCGASIVSERLLGIFGESG